MIEVRPVTNRKDMNNFLQVPELVYKDNSYFIPQLKFERRQHFSKKNPYFKHAQHQFFVAYKNKLPIGRISAQIDEMSQSKGAPKMGHFGLIEAMDEETYHALLGAAETWLKERGMEKISGPYSLSINDELGLLIEGFDKPPAMLMNYALPWYGTATEAAGYNKAKDLLAYILSPSIPKHIIQMAEKITGRSDIHVRSLDTRHFHKEINLVINIFNESWKNNWGFVPITPDEISYMAHNIKPFIKQNLFYIVEVKGVPSGMIIATLDTNQALAGLNGKLLPFGWAKLLWRIKMHKISRKRVIMMGILPELQNTILGAGLAMALIARVINAITEQDRSEVELSWILEDNIKIIGLIEQVGGKVYKRYRMYEKALV